MPAPERVANIIKISLAEIGIPVEVVLNDPERAPARAVGRRARPGAARLVQRQRRSRQLPLHAARLRQHHGQPTLEHRLLQQQLVPRRHRHGPAYDRSHGARAPLLAGAGDPGDRRALGAAGALEGRLRGARQPQGAGGATVGDGPLPLGGARRHDAASPPSEPQPPGDDGAGDRALDGTPQGTLEGPRTAPVRRRRQCRTPSTASRATRRSSRRRRCGRRRTCPVRAFIACRGCSRSPTCARPRRTRWRRCAGAGCGAACRRS